MRILSNEAKSAMYNKKLLIQATPFSDVDDGCLSDQNIFRLHMPRLPHACDIEITSEKKTSNPTSGHVSNVGSLNTSTN